MGNCTKPSFSTLCTALRPFIIQYMGKKVAFILASIHEGTSVRMWNRCLDSFNYSEDALFVFPGGRLDFKARDEYLKNSIYRLVNSENFDGMIAWASTLTGQASVDEVRHFMGQYSSLPCITIGLKAGDDIPYVGFDAYSGFYKLVKHLIDIHGKRKIAFLRGPENHESSQARFTAYMDALRSSGLRINHDLITSPHSWGRGREALCQLIDERGLMPSVDFDAMVCASDLMMFAAVHHLEELGVNIPSALSTGGFNDTETNKLIAIAPTTVRMPVDEMIDSAIASLYRRMEGDGKIEDILLECDLVIRHSCGCEDPFASDERLMRKLEDVSSFIDWAVRYSASRIKREDLEYLIEYLMRTDDFSSSRRQWFLSSFSRLAAGFLKQGGEYEDLVEIALWASRLLPLKEDIRDFCQKNLVRVILDVFAQVNGEKEHIRNEENSVMNHFKMELLSTHALSYLSDIMKKYLPQLGFRQAYIVLRKEGEDESRLLAGYDGDGSVVVQQDFLSGTLLPHSYEYFITKGAFVVEPVIMDKESVGYILLEFEKGHNELVIEDIMASISSALKGITLLESANEAKRRAEEAESESSAFYANLSEELREPLCSIRKTLSLVKDSATKRRVVSNVVKAEHLLDLILTEKGEMEFRRSTIETVQFFSSFVSAHSITDFFIPDLLPALYSDRDKLEKAFDLLYQLACEAESGQVRLEVSAQTEGVCVKLEVERWNPLLVRNNPSLLLAEKITVLLSGSFRFLPHALMITLPYPNLSGKDAQAQSPGTAVFIKASPESKLPSSLSAFTDVIPVLEKDLAGGFSIPASVSHLIYNAGEKRKNSVVLNLMHNHVKAKNLPFLCFCLPSSPLDIWTCVSSMAAGDKAAGAGIVCAGSMPSGLERLDAFGSRTVFRTFDELLSSLSSSPSLIILGECRSSQIAALRENRFSSSVPVLICKDSFTEEEVESILLYPNLLICNSGICEAQEFISRLIGIFGGSQILPPLTGAMVKKAIVYLNKNAARPVIRWQVAESVNISEDYLTRIFRREMGISPWDYLSRYRVRMASRLLTSTGMSVNEIAGQTGFQDQAYFCRVFKKITGMSPRRLREQGTKV